MLSLIASSGCGLVIPTPAPAPAMMRVAAAAPVFQAPVEVDNIFPSSFTLAAADLGSRKVITSFESELDAFEAKQKAADQALAERKAALKAREAAIEAEAAAKAAKQAELDAAKAAAMQAAKEKAQAQAAAKAEAKAAKADTKKAAAPKSSSKYGEVQKVNKQAERSTCFTTLSLASHALAAAAPKPALSFLCVCVSVCAHPVAERIARGEEAPSLF